MFNANLANDCKSQGDEEPWIFKPKLNRLVFNFSASYIGGGMTRLHAYASWFNKHGGTNFLIHPDCESLRNEFPSNRYIVVRATKLQRFFGDFSYLKSMQQEWGKPDFYYSYGIPIPAPIGRHNWLHFNNILPFIAGKVPRTLLDWVKRLYLGPQLRRSASWVDVISAESAYSLAILGASVVGKALLSVNGADEQIAAIGTPPQDPLLPVAVIVGTWRYKAIADSIKVFEHLRTGQPDLRLHIFGSSKILPRGVFRRPEISVEGFVTRERVLSVMSTARYYISTTIVENASNASSEGIFSAERSIVSDIKPHRELLDGEECEQVSLPKVRMPLLLVRRDQLTGKNLRSWDHVVRRMLTTMDKKMTRI
jgi:hypothetical protein